MLRITNHISIDEREIEEDFVRSSGPGGQNVNKLNTAVQLALRRAAFAVAAVRRSRAAGAARRTAADQGRRAGADRAAPPHPGAQPPGRARPAGRLIQRAAVRPSAARPTKPTAGSRKRRLESKKRRGTIKGLRQAQALVRLTDADGAAASSTGIATPAAAGRAGYKHRMSPRADSPKDPEHARPPAVRRHRQPHRRRRGGRAAGERRQGTGRERARRRRAQHRGRDRRRRAPPHPRHRRRRRHDARRPALAVERHATSKLPDDDLLRHPHARLSRRGAAVDRLGGAAGDHHAARERAARLGDRGRRRRQVGAEAGRARARHARRGARPVLRHAGAAQIPEDRPHRGRGDPRCGAPARDGRPDVALHARGRGARAGDLGRRAARRAGTACAARRHPGRRVPGQRGRGDRRARAACASRASPRCRR